MPRYGIYATDGKHVQGELGQYSNLAAQLAEGSAALYIESDHEKVIFGSAVDVQKEGRRRDMLIVIMEYPLTSPHRNAVHNFLLDVCKELADANYRILGAGGEESFFQPIYSKHQEFSSRSISAENGEQSGCQPGGDAVIPYLIGRLIAQKPGYATAKQMACSINLISEIFEIMHPILHLGYRFAVGRYVINRSDPFDLCVLPEKPRDQDVADLDSGIIDDPERSLYTKIGKVLANEQIQAVLYKSYRNRSTPLSKEKLFTEINTGIRRQMTPSQRFEHQNTLERIESPLKFEILVEDAVYVALSDSNTRYLEGYFLSAFNIEDFEKCLYKLPAEDFLRFFNIARPVLLRLDDKTGGNILRRLSSYARELQQVEEELKGRYDPTPKSVQREADRRGGVSDTPGSQPARKELHEHNDPVPKHLQRRIDHHVTMSSQPGKKSKSKPRRLFPIRWILFSLAAVAVIGIAALLVGALGNLSENDQPTPSPPTIFGASATVSPEETPVPSVVVTPMADTTPATPTPEETPAPSVAVTPIINTTPATSTPEETNPVFRLPSDDKRVELFVDGLSPSTWVKEMKIKSYDEGKVPENVLSSDRYPEDLRWTLYSEYYVIEPLKQPFGAEARLVFLLNDTQFELLNKTQPKQLVVRHTNGPEFLWPEEVPMIEDRNVTISITETGIYALFIENATDNASKSG